MPSTTSPILAPAYTCGTHISVLDIDDEHAFISTLNPSAAKFVPSFYPIEDSSDEARRGKYSLSASHKGGCALPVAMLVFCRDATSPLPPLDTHPLLNSPVPPLHP